jgi:threonyl-tRNA synthetase
MSPWPGFIGKRIKIFDELMASYKNEISKKERKQIKVTLPDGKIIDAISWETTPLHVAQGISKGLADKVVIAKINNEV